MRKSLLALAVLAASSHAFASMQVTSPTDQNPSATGSDLNPVSLGSQKAKAKGDVPLTTGQKDRASAAQGQKAQAAKMRAARADKPQASILASKADKPVAAAKDLTVGQKAKPQAKGRLQVAKKQDPARGERAS